jgi:hypothetical protein
MPHQRLFVLFALLSTGAHAQWLNYPTPGIPKRPADYQTLAHRRPGPPTANRISPECGKRRTLFLAIPRMSRGIARNCKSEFSFRILPQV